MTDRPAVADEPGRKPRMGLSGKLLILTILFVMIAEVLIYVPSIATFRHNWLSDRLSAAYTAALVLEAAPGVSDNTARAILDSIGARAVAMKMGTQRRLLAGQHVHEEVVARAAEEIGIRARAVGERRTISRPARTRLRAIRAATACR